MPGVLKIRGLAGLEVGFVGGLVGAFEGGEVFVEEEVDAAGGVVVGRGGFAIGCGFAAAAGLGGFAAGGELAVPAGEGGAVPLEWCAEVGGIAATVEGVGDGAEEGVLVDGGVAVCRRPEGGEDVAVEGVGRRGCAAGDAVQDVVVDDHCQGVGGAHAGDMGVDGVDPCLGGVAQGRGCGQATAGGVGDDVGGGADGLRGVGVVGGGHGVRGAGCSRRC